MLKIWQFTDIHLFKRDPMPTEALYTDQKTQLESEAIIDAGLAAFLAEPDCDIMIISGDLTFNGHAEEHRQLIPKLRRVQEAGKRVIVITATHDYGLVGNVEDTNDSGLPPLERPDGKVFRHELRGLYDEFGFRDAIAEYTDGLSYVAQLAPGYRLLCLNCDGDGRKFYGFDEAQMTWILAQIEQAKQDGQQIIGMTHYPSLPPVPIYQRINVHDILGDYKETTRRLANAGLRCLFTGHTHMHNIEPIITPEGNPYWDITTGALVAYPGLYRVLELEGSRLRVTTRAIEDFDYDRGGLSVREYLGRHFDLMLKRIIEGLAGDFDSAADYCWVLGMSREKFYQNRRVLTLVGKFINSITLGGLGALLACRHKIPKSVRGVKFKELLLELIRNVFAGEEYYSRETDIAKAMMAITGRLDSLLKKKLRGAGIESLPELFLSLIYDPSPDDAVEIAL